MRNNWITVLGVVVLLVIVGFLVFGGDNDENVAQERNNANSTNLDGIGGPDNGEFNPLDPNSTSTNATSTQESTTDDGNIDGNALDPDKG